MVFERIEQISKGWSSNIWKIRYKGKVCVLKESREKSNRKNLAEREGKMLSRANKIGIGPKLLKVDFEKNFVIMEYVKGDRIVDWVNSREFEKASKEQVYYLLKKLFEQVFLLDEIGLRHSQLQVGKNILVKKIIKKRKIFYEPVIIDFEKASMKKGKKKNEGQIKSFFFYNPNGNIAKKVRKKLNLKL